MYTFQFSMISCREYISISGFIMTFDQAIYYEPFPESDHAGTAIIQVTLVVHKYTGHRK